MRSRRCFDAPFVDLQVRQTLLVPCAAAFFPAFSPPSLRGSDPGWRHAARPIPRLSNRHSTTLMILSGERRRLDWSQSTSVVQCYVGAKSTDTNRRHLRRCNSGATAVAHLSANFNDNAERRAWIPPVLSLRVSNYLNIAVHRPIDQCVWGFLWTHQTTVSYYDSSVLLSACPASFWQTIRWPPLCMPV